MITFIIILILTIVAIILAVVFMNPANIINPVNQSFGAIGEQVGIPGM